MIYDPTGHALLSTAAQALTPEQLEAYADAAEIELGLVGTSYTGDDADKATLAVVYWINCRLAHESTGGTLESRSEEKGNERVSVTFANGARFMAFDPCTQAHLLARSLVGAGSYTALQRIR